MNPPLPQNPRTLHLIDDRGPDACGPTLALLAQTLREDQQQNIQGQLLVLGGSPLAHAAAQQGIDPIQRVGIPLGKPLLAPTVLHHAFSDHAHHGPVHGIEAWSLVALGAAAIYRPHTPRVLHVLRDPEPQALRRMNKLMMRAGFDVRVTHERLKQTLIQSGLPAGRVFLQPATLQSPPPNTTAHPTAQQTHRPRVVALLGEPAWAVPVHDTALAVSMTMEITQRPLQLMVHPDQAQRARGQRLLEGLGQPDAIIQEPRLDTPWDILPAIDAVMIGTTATPLTTQLVQDAGLPILAPDLPAHRDTLDDQHPKSSIFWAPDARPRHLAHALTQWLRDQDPTIRPPRATVGKLLAI